MTVQTTDLEQRQQAEIRKLESETLRLKKLLAEGRPYWATTMLQKADFKECQTVHRECQDGYQVWKIDDGEQHYVVALSPASSLQEHVNNLGGYSSIEEYREDVGTVTVECLLWYQPIIVRYESGEAVMRSASQWAISERGVFCSTNW